jgi:pimeloyl-ACP methyl ester carboxylesterase
VAVVALRGSASGAAPSSSLDTAFAGMPARRELDGVGHHLPFEAPRAFADAALDLVRAGKWRT